MKKSLKAKNFIHIGFTVGLALKGLYGLLEIISGIYLQFFNPYRLYELMLFLARHELSEDPQDKVANFLVTLTYSFPISAQHFTALYLVSHGLIKCVLIFLLWRQKLWAYPLTIFLLLLFITYQIYRITINPEVFLALITFSDMVMLALTFLEYKNIKIELSSKDRTAHHKQII